MLSIETSSFLHVALLITLILCLGSFLTSVTYRLPLMLGNKKANYNEISLLKPRSFCDHCQTTLPLRALIPVISFLTLKARSLCCAERISARYFLIEIIFLALSLMLYFHFGLTTKLIGGLIFTWILLALACIDMETFLLPDLLTIPLGFIGFMFNTFSTFTSLHSAILGSVLGYISYALIAWLMKAIRKKDMLGQGDLKLIAAVGSWLGWQVLPTFTLIASLSGLIVGLCYITNKKTFNAKIPFGPFLALAGFILFLVSAK